MLFFPNLFCSLYLFESFMPFSCGRWLFSWGVCLQWGGFDCKSPVLWINQCLKWSGTLIYLGRTVFQLRKSEFVFIYLCILLSHRHWCWRMGIKWSVLSASAREGSIFPHARVWFISAIHHATYFPLLILFSVVTNNINWPLTVNPKQ